MVLWAIVGCLISAGCIFEATQLNSYGDEWSSCTRLGSDSHAWLTSCLVDSLKLIWIGSQSEKGI